MRLSIDSRGKELPADAIPRRMNATGFFHGYRLLLNMTFALRSWTTGTIFPLCFLCRKVNPCFLVHPLHAVSQTISVCVIERISVCALTRTYITCTSTNYVDVPELPPSRPGTQPIVMLLCGFFWRSNRDHHLLLLVMRALATSIQARTYLLKFNN